jgi:hypothetical protein
VGEIAAIAFDEVEEVAPLEVYESVGIWGIEDEKGDSDDWDWGWLFQHSLSVLLCV